MSLTQIADTLRNQKAYDQGRLDARTVAKTCSPADLRDKLHLMRGGEEYSLPLDPYTRGFVLELRAQLTERNPQGVRRGQGGACKGLLTVKLVGPTGCGKSLVARILATRLFPQPVGPTSLTVRSPLHAPPCPRRTPCGFRSVNCARSSSTKPRV